MRIQFKLFVAFLVAGISLVGLMFFLMQWSLSKGLLEFVNTKERNAIAPFMMVLKQRYKQNGNWRWIDNRHRLFHRLFRDSRGREHVGFERRPPPPPPRGAREHPPRSRPGEGYPMPDVSLFDQDKKFLVGKPDIGPQAQWLALDIDQQVVGYLVIPRRHGITEGYELTLLEQQRLEFLLISLLLGLLTIVIAIPVAINLVRPIKRLATAMNELTQGNYQTRIELKRRDELGHLARDVNELAMTLEKNQTLRKRWLASISHELRTPIAVMKGEMEAVIDGVRPLNQEHVHSTYQEIQRLTRLVEDLYELSSADIGAMKYRKEAFDLIEFIEQNQAHFVSLLTPGGISLSVEKASAVEQQAIIWGDPDRLAQLFNNLMINCSKYANGGTRVLLTLKTTPAQVVVTIEDDGKGVPGQHLDNLFEHLYRVDDSRNRNTGGAGLGLAICKQIVEAHRGQIHAQPAKLGGLAIVIALPRA